MELHLGGSIAYEMHEKVSLAGPKVAKELMSSTVVSGEYLHLLVTTWAPSCCNRVQVSSGFDDAIPLGGVSGDVTLRVKRHQRGSGLKAETKGSSIRNEACQAGGLVGRVPSAAQRAPCEC